MSDKQEVIKKAKNYLGLDVKIKPSTRKGKKFMVENPKGKMVHFGAKGYDDFTKHKDDTRRQNYLSRATKIKGDWKKDKYSPNNLAINILW
jgi:hypothetical protein